MFPMGKVKEEDNTSVTYRQNVSIPDGKGKDGYEDGFVQSKIGYQFPMGKVKNNILCCDFII